MIANRTSSSAAFLFAAAAAVLFFLLPVGSVSAAVDCPKQNDPVSPSIYCTGSNYWCGGTCQPQPACPTIGPGDPNGVLTERNCTACACACPAGEINCIGQTPLNNCQLPNGGCATLHRQAVCNDGSAVPTTTQMCGGCSSGYQCCGGAGLKCVGGTCESVTDPSCPAPGIWDPCLRKCIEKYILSNPTVAQSPQIINAKVQGDMSMADGNLVIVSAAAGKGDLFVSSGKALRADGAGVTNYNIGNWGTGATGLKLNLFGELCLSNGTVCRSYWPTGLPDGTLAGQTVRYDGAAWVTSDQLINDGTNIGIGTTAPARNLDIRGTAGGVIARLNDDIGGGSRLWTGLGLARSAAEKWFIGMDNATDKLLFRRTGSSNDLVIDTAGNVGIGTANPQKNVDVAGTVGGVISRLNDISGGGSLWTGSSLARGGNEKWFVGIDNVSDKLLFRLAGSTNAMVIDTVGNVGIGTDTPNAPLQVANYVNFKPTARLTAIGYQAGNAAIGGMDNALLGYQAAQSLTTGAANVAIGTRALGSATVAGGNIAIGYETAFSMTDAYSNIAIGQQTMYFNNGERNIALGDNALNGQAGLSTGDYNTAIGYNALESNTTGADNVAMGTSAMRTNTSGFDNVALGQTALRENTSGNNNVAIGNLALWNNTSGNNNLALGQRAGQSSVSGSNNVFIGYGANSSSSSLTNAVAIGYNAIVGASNSMILGGTGGNAINVGVGTANPEKNIDVYATAGGAVTRLNDGAGNLWTGYSVARSSSEKWFVGMANSSDNLLIRRDDSSNAVVVDSSGNVGIGSDPPNQKLDVAGIAQMNGFILPTGAVDKYVLTSDASGAGSWRQILFADACTGGKFDHLTAGSYDGNQTSYANVNGYCAADGSQHVCTPDEILRSVYCTTAMPLPASGTAWVANGPPGFTSPAANDCAGFTSNAATSYGAFWQFAGAAGGKAFATSCSLSLKFACCKQ